MKQLLAIGCKCMIHFYYYYCLPIFSLLWNHFVDETALARTCNVEVIGPSLARGDSTNCNI